MLSFDLRSRRSRKLPRFVDCNDSSWPRIATLCLAKNINVSIITVKYIVAKCPGLAGTVPEFRPLSRLCPGWHKIILMSRIFYEFKPWAANLELEVPMIPSVVQGEPCRSARTSLDTLNLTQHVPRCFGHAHHKLWPQARVWYTIHVENGGVAPMWHVCSRP